MTMPANNSPAPTVVGTVSFAVAVTPRFCAGSAFMFSEKPDE